MRMKVTYELVIATLDEWHDVIDNYYYELRDFKNFVSDANDWLNETHDGDEKILILHLQLWRDEYTDDSGLEDRDWLTLDHNADGTITLNTLEFDNGAEVPKYIQKIFERQG